MRDILKRRRRNKGDGRLPSADWLVGQGDGRGGGGVCSNGMSQPTPHSLSHFSSTSFLLCPLVEAPPPQSPNPTLPEARHARFRQYY